jgi:hypothetical protein
MQMNDVQYVPNTKFVSLHLEEEEKVSRLWNHSDNLTYLRKVLVICCKCMYLTIHLYPASTWVLHHTHPQPLSLNV